MMFTCQRLVVKEEEGVSRGLDTNARPFTDQFVGKGHRSVPGGDPLKNRQMLLDEGFTDDEVNNEGTFWNFLDEVP